MKKKLKPRERLGRCPVCRRDYYVGEPLMPYEWASPRSVHYDCFNRLPAKHRRQQFGL